MSHFHHPTGWYSDGRLIVDFIANNRIAGIDFATVHAYLDQWLSSSNDQYQFSFLNNWFNTHIQDAQYILRKPILLAEFGKSYKDSGFSTYQRDQLFNTVYYKVYASARRGGAAAAEPCVPAPGSATSSSTTRSSVSYPEASHHHVDSSYIGDSKLRQ